jgi:hypothetical protein
MIYPINKKTGMSIQVGDGFGVNMTYMGKRITGCCARPMPNHPNPEKRNNILTLQLVPRNMEIQNMQSPRIWLQPVLMSEAAFICCLEHITTAVWLTKGSGQIVYITTPKSEIMMTYETIMGIIIINNYYYVNICHIRNIHQHNIWKLFPI